MATDTATLVCNKPECTLRDTGQCVLSNEPKTCPDRIASLTSVATVDSAVGESTGEAVLLAPDEPKRFAASLTLSAGAATRLMHNRYCKVIGILGVPNTGKTASLVSLYLLLSHNLLTGYRFLDSRSIMAFEEISSGARRWNESQPPSELTVHTELKEEREAGYLHLRLKNIAANYAHDLLLTDLPGEWTSSLMDKNRTDRLSFLRSSERILSMVNAEDLDNIKSRTYTIHRLELLLDRLCDFLKDDLPPVTFVITHCDKPKASVVKHLHPLLNRIRGARINVCEIASFSNKTDIKPGHGLSALVDMLIIPEKTHARENFWISNSTTDRSMLNIGLNGSSTW